MKNLKSVEKNAIIRILKDIIFADGIVDQREIELLKMIECNIGVGEISDSEVDKMSSLAALAIVRELPMDIRMEFARLMGRMIVVDNDINYKEVELYNLVVDSCSIPYPFNEEELLPAIDDDDATYDADAYQPNCLE